MANPLMLQGFGTSLTVHNRRLIVREGRFSPLSYTRKSDGKFREPKLLKFRPRQLNHDAVFVQGTSGWVSFEAIRWLVHHNAPLIILDYDGSILSATMPPQPARGDLRRSQVEAYLDSEKRLAIVKSLIQAKLEHSTIVLEWLRETHDIELEIRRFRKESSGLSNTRTVDDVRRVEARAAQFFWDAFAKAVPLKLEFKSRSTRARHRQNNASDPTNALLNYGYSFLQSYVRRAINTTGLDLSLGYLHEDKPATTPLVFDFEEPFRFLVDLAVLEMVESKMFSWNDFYFTAEDYRLRVKPVLLDRYADLLREQFNSGVIYEGKHLMWDAVMSRKFQEFARFLLGKTDQFELVTPQPALVREDARAIRTRIRSLTSSEAKKLGIGKST